MFKLFRAGLVGWMAAKVILATVIYVSSNPGIPAQAKEGSIVISGFGISRVEYQQAANPSPAEAVGLNLGQAAGPVLVKLTSRDPNSIACQSTSGFQWDYPFPAAIPLASLEELPVLVRAEYWQDPHQGG